LVHPEIPGIDLLKLYLGTPSPSSADLFMITGFRNINIAELGLGVPGLKPDLC